MEGLLVLAVVGVGAYFLWKKGYFAKWLGEDTDVK